MAEEPQNASVKASVIETSEETFKPGLSAPISAELQEEGAPAETITEEQAQNIFAQLEPEEQDSSTFYSQDYEDFYYSYIPPPPTTFPGIPDYTETQKTLIINIESTATLPWESRLICIGVLDPSAAEPQIMQFIQEKEEDTIREFVDWFNSTTYAELAGYNVAFDYRFLYALMQRYRLTSPKWTDLDLYDLMTQQEQVKQSFVPGFNKSGTLEEWSTYLFGTIPYAPQEKVYQWLKEGNVDEIIAFNDDKVTKAYFLYTLNKVVQGKVSIVEGAGAAAASQAVAGQGRRFPNTNPGTEETMARCPVCQTENYMDKSAASAECFICKAKIANPTK